MKRQTQARVIIWLLCWAIPTAFTTAQAQTPSHFEVRKPGGSIALISPSLLPAKAGQELNSQIKFATGGVHGDLRISIKADTTLGEVLSEQIIELKQPIDIQIQVPLQIVLNAQPSGYLNIMTEEYFDDKPSLVRNFAIPVSSQKLSKREKSSDNTVALPAQIKTKSLK